MNTVKKPNADYWIDKLQLERHVEGGAFREVYRSDLVLPQSILPAACKGDRVAGTSIYFLLQANEFSALHRIAADELWHFYFGDTLIVYEIGLDGNLIVHKLGADWENGERFQCVIKAGSWFGAKVENGAAYALVGCTVSPGFDFADFELADKHTMMTAFPQHRLVIDALCH